MSLKVMLEQKIGGTATFTLLSRTHATLFLTVCVIIFSIWTRIAAYERPGSWRRTKKGAPS
jgi:hypothetical protein